MNDEATRRSNSPAFTPQLNSLCESTLLLVQNIISRSDSPDDIKECMADVRESLEEVFSAMKEGEKF